MEHTESQRTEQSFSRVMSHAFHKLYLSSYFFLGFVLCAACPLAVV